MTRKERQQANGVGKQQVAQGSDRSNREQRFKPLKRREEVKPISITEKLDLKKDKK